MPLKPRTTAPAGSRSRVLDDAPIVSRDRPEPELEDSDKKLEEPLLENDEPVVETDDKPVAESDTTVEPDTTVAPSGDQDNGDQNSTSSAKPTRRRAAGVSTAPLADGVDPKARLSEIQRDLKQLRSEYTSELKSLESHYNEKLKALRSEHELLTAQLTEATFTL